jgi:hypothetical protein
MIIYYFKNKVNGKGYVGQHCGDGNHRYDSHIREALQVENPAPLYSAIRKYGIDNFEYEILETVPVEKGQRFLDIREIYWIHKKNTYIGNGKGYNRTLGGGGGVRAFCSKQERKNRKINVNYKWGQYEKEGVLIDSFETAKQAANVLGFNNYRSIYHAASWHEGIGKQGKTAGGFMWKRVPNSDDLPIKITPLNLLGEKPKIKPENKNILKGNKFKTSDLVIAQYDFNGKLVKLWPNNAEKIGRDLNLEGDAIRRNLRGEGFLTYGFVWKRFPKNNVPEKLPRAPLVTDGFRLDEYIFYNEPVLKINILDDDIIALYKSISEIPAPFMEQINYYQEAISKTNLDDDYIRWVFKKDYDNGLFFEHSFIKKISKLIESLKD